MSDPDDPETVERLRLEGLARAGQLIPDLFQRLDALNRHPPASNDDIARTAAYRAAALKAANPPSETRRQQSGKA